MLVPDLVKEVEKGATFGVFYFTSFQDVASTVMYLQQKLHTPWIDLRVNDIHDLIAYLPNFSLQFRHQTNNLLVMALYQMCSFSTIPAIRDECRVREEGMVLCTRGALSGMSAG